MVQQTAEPAPAVAPDGAGPRRRRWGLGIVAIAVVGIVIAFVVGFSGLFANPVKSTSANGTATLSGTFEPYQCNTASCDGYIQAGARSVFVQFPAHCAPPQRGTQITVVARPAPDLGTGSYRATACA